MRFAVGVFALLAVSGSASAQCDGSCQCYIDDCFIALAGESPFVAQPTINDCRDFLWERSTWGSATSTVTSYVESGVITDTAAETLFVTVSEGSTTLETITNIVTATQTITSGDGTFTGEPSTTVRAPLRRRRRRRQAGVIPAYASACGGAIGYSSACTCLGVSADGTRWFEVPTVTTTVTSATPLTETVFETETVTTTVDGDFAGATETETVVKTATQEVIQPLYTSFVLQLTNDDVNGAYKGYFLRSVPDPNNSNLRRLRFSGNIAGATIYKADSNGEVTTDADGIGFAQDDTQIGPGLWQEPASANANWIGYACTINEDRLLKCISAANDRLFLAADPSDNGNLRAFSYLEYLHGQGCYGPLIVAAVPQDTAATPPAVARDVVIRVKSVAGNDQFQGHYFGTQDQSSQPFPRFRTYESINDATRFKADPVSGIILGPSDSAFVATPPTPAQPHPFLLGESTGGRVIHHMTVLFPSNDIQLTYPPETKYLSAVIPGSGGTPFLRIHYDTNFASDEIGITIEVVDV